MGPFYITLHLVPGGVAWDLRSGTPDGFSVRIAAGEAFSYAAACYQASRALVQHVKVKEVS